MLPILLIAALVAAVWWFCRDSGSLIEGLEEADRIAGFDPHESIGVAEHRVENRLIAEATRRNREGR